jgi:hypothetical protein
MVFWRSVRVGGSSFSSRGFEGWVRVAKGKGREGTGDAL